MFGMYASKMSIDEVEQDNVRVCISLHLMFLVLYFIFKYVLFDRKIYF